MDKTRIECFDSTWNPVTGCFHGCEYCYARSIANRFGGYSAVGDIKTTFNPFMNLPELDKAVVIKRKNGHITDAPYPFGFTPTLHRYRLNEYIDKKGRNIFVCSMADLFGKWVTDEWIEEVFKACEKAPQHNYLFLTKNPGRYVDLINKGILPGTDNMWYGYSLTTDKDYYWQNSQYKTFASMEPIMGPIPVPPCDWVIIGAETGNRKDRVIPKREWIEEIVKKCWEMCIPIFMKSSLADIWEEPLIQEFPKQLIQDHQEQSS